MPAAFRAVTTGSSPPASRSRSVPGSATPKSKLSPSDGATSGAPTWRYRWRALRAA
jgi:hypothetical protein